MSIALVTVLFFIFLFPVIFFTRFYFTEEFSKQYFKSTYFELLLSTVLPSIVLHTIALSIASNGFNYELDFKSILVLLLDIDSLDDKLQAINSTTFSIKSIICYNTFLWFFSGFSGYFFKKIIRRFKIDRKWKLFRFQNEWHYLITGEILDFPKISGEANDIDFVSIDALVETGNWTLLYSGIIEDYVLSKQGA